MANFLHNNYLEDQAIRLIIAGFWALFWLLNVIDKFIAGPTFLWVGEDRFAQFTKFFASLGVEQPGVAIAALVIGTLFEIVAFTLLAAAFYNLILKHRDRAHTLFSWGMLVGLLLFSWFAVGDQIFGDRFELLEHTLFWLAIVVSWGAYMYFPGRSRKVSTPFSWKQFCQEYLLILVAIAVIGIAAIATVVPVSVANFERMHEVVEPTYIGGGVYKFELTFLDRGYVWEASLERFIEDHPELRVLAIQTSPPELRTEADNVIIFVVTESRAVAQRR